MHRFGVCCMNTSLVSIGRAARLLGVSIDTLRRWDAAGTLVAVRADARSHRYYRLADIDALMNNPTSVAKTWAAHTHPQPLDQKVHCTTRDVFQARLEDYHNKLSTQLSIDSAALVIAVTGEIGNNSFDHNLGNWPDMMGIYFGVDTNRKSVVLADRGLGVLATLRRVDPTLANDTEALTVAFTKVISGRYPEARGNGLKFVRSIVTQFPLTLYFQSGSMYIELSKKHTKVLPTKADTFLRGCFAVIEYGGLL